MRLLKYANKVRLRKRQHCGTQKRMSKKTYIEVKKTSDNVGGKPTCGFSLQHNTFSALNHAQDFGTTVKESFKRTTSWKRDTLTK